MDLKDLRKWVDGYGLIFKVRYSKYVGCEVRVHKPGYSNPMITVIEQDCTVALSKVENLLIMKEIKGDLYVS